MPGMGLDFPIWSSALVVSMILLIDILKEVKCLEPGARAGGLFLHTPLTFLSKSVQAAVTEYHRLRGLGNSHLFLTVLEAGNPRLRC